MAAVGEARALGEFDPLPDNPEIQDLAKLVMQVHACVELHNKATVKQFKKLDIDRKKAKLFFETELNNLKADTAGIKKAFNIVNDGDEGLKTSKKPVGLMGRWEFVRNISTSGVIIIAIWKAIDALWPELGTLAVAIEHYVRHL